MKKILHLVILLLLGSNLYADCAGRNLSVWPESEYLIQNTVIIITGFATSQQIVKGLNKKYPIYLQADDHRVKLMVNELLVGEFQLTQALLQPEEQLHAGKEYKLVIDSLPLEENLNPLSEEYKEIKWLVIEGSDHQPPRWITQPKEISKSFQFFGSGPATFVYYSCDIAEQSEYLVKTTLHHIGINKSTTYYLKVKDEKIGVGHGICSGAFWLKEGADYEVEFCIMDASGNLSMEQPGQIKFIAPINEEVMPR